MNTQLNEVILEGGIRSPNFFNGRLLSGEDMSAEQAATMERFRRSGRAFGSGVAYGLKVAVKHPDPGETRDETTDPVLTVTAGLGVNRCGEVVQLSDNVDIQLARAASSSANPTNGKIFICCVPPKGSGGLGADGIYLLTAAPAVVREGRAPVNGLSADSAKCNSKYFVAGAQFNLVPVPAPLLTKIDFTNPNLVRNLVASLCFGTTDPRKAAFLADPFSTPATQYGLIDDLRADQLTDCAVPLAMIYWTEAGIQFIDLWSVRRRVTAPAGDESLPSMARVRGASEAEAIFLQFQEQREALRLGLPDPPNARVSQYFSYLPPVGILPLSNPGALRGFVVEKFFEQRPYHSPVFVEGSRVSHIIETALEFPPIDLAAMEMVWLYLVRENIEPTPGPGGPKPPYLIFVSGHVPFLGEPHLDVARWDYSNFV